MPTNSCSYVLIYLLPVDLTFGRLDDIVFHLGGQIPQKKHQKGDWIGILYTSVFTK